MSIEVMSREIQESLENFEIEEFSKSEKELGELKLESKKRIDSYKYSLDLKFKKELDSRKKNILGSAKSNGKTLVLESQKEVFENLNFEVLKYFENLSDGDLLFFYSHLFKRASEIIDIGYIKCSEKDFNLVQKLAKKGVIVELDNYISKGLILETKDRKNCVDLRVKVILDSMIKDREEELISLLYK